MILKSTFVVALTFLVSLSCFAGGGKANVDFSISDVSVRLGQKVTFEDTSTKGTCNLITSWTWDFGDGASPETANTQYPGPVTYSTPGEKSIRLTLEGDDCDPCFLLKTIKVINPPIPTMSQWSLVIFGLLITSIAVGRIWMANKTQA